jgi:hypothetical protein
MIDVALKRFIRFKKEIYDDVKRLQKIAQEEEKIRVAEEKARQKKFEKQNAIKEANEKKEREKLAK